MNNNFLVPTAPIVPAYRGCVGASPAGQAQDAPSPWPQGYQWLALAGVAGFFVFAYTSMQQEQKRIGRARSNPSSERFPPNNRREHAIENVMGILHRYGLWNRKVRVHRHGAYDFSISEVSGGRGWESLKAYDEVSKTAHEFDYRVTGDGSELHFDLLR